MSRRLRIIMTADPEIPVPPPYYGGIERIVHMLACGLTKLGHEVHLFAHPDSSVPARLIPYHQGRRSGSLKDTAINALQIKNYVRKMNSADIVHSFSRLAYLLPFMRSSIPKIQSYQRRITPRSVRFGILLAGRTLSFAACSKACANTASSVGGHWTIIPNGVPTEKYRFNPSVSVDAPLVFLGRVERIKGAHTAIEVAKKSGRRLIIAGNRVNNKEGYEYFTREISPYCDGDIIRYVGPVNDIQKNELLGKTAALLFPVEWEEPFGIVMVEALACGTPVISFKRGAAPEVVEDGLNGFLCDTKEEMVNAVKRIPEIKRERCREIAEAKFSDSVIVKKYLSLYESMLNEVTL